MSVIASSPQAMIASATRNHCHHVIMELHQMQPRPQALRQRQTARRSPTTTPSRARSLQRHLPQLAVDLGILRAQNGAHALASRTVPSLSAAAASVAATAHKTRNVESLALIYGRGSHPVPLQRRQFHDRLATKSKIFPPPKQAMHLTQLASLRRAHGPLHHHQKRSAPQPRNYLECRPFPRDQFDAGTEPQRSQ